MDDDCESEKQNKNIISMFGLSNFLQSLRIRYPFCNDNEMDKLESFRNTPMSTDEEIDVSKYADLGGDDVKEIDLDEIKKEKVRCHSVVGLPYAGAEDRRNALGRTKQLCLCH